MTHAKHPRLRSAHKKVTTGCKTCKRRRVKCDEERPECLRCQRSGNICDYGIVPTADERQYLRPFVLSPGDEAPPLLPQPGIMHLSRSESVYFDIFRTRVIEALSVHSFGHSSIARTLIRESIGDENTRRSVLSIGALLQTRQASTVVGKNHAATANTWDRVAFSDAIGYHAKALTQFSARVAAGGAQMPRRSILISSLLFIIFENLLGNTKSVDHFMSSTVMVLRDILHLGKVDAAAAISPGLDDGGVEDLKSLLLMMASVNGWALPSYRSQRSTMAAIDVIAPELPPEGKPPPLAEWPAEWQTFMTRAALWGLHAWITVAINGEPATDKLIAEQKVILAQLRSWADRTRSQIPRATDEGVKWACTFMLFGSVGTYPMYACVLDTEEMEYDSQLDYFRDAVELAEARYLLRKKHPILQGPSLSVINEKELQIIHFVVRHCRDNDIRHRALALCEGLTGPDSSWDEKAMYISGKIMVDLEEATRDDEQLIPRENRQRWTESDWNETHTAIDVAFVAPSTGKETRITVGRASEFSRLMNTS